MPFSYTAYFVPFGKRKAAEHRVMDTVDVSVRRLEAGGFVLVARVQSANARPDDALAEIRSDNGSFYRPCVLETSTSGKQFDEDVLDLVSTASENTPFGELQALSNIDPPNAPAVLKSISGNFVTSDRLDRISKIAALARDIAIWNGKIWILSGEPYYIHDGDGRFGVETWTGWAGLTVSPTNVVRADRLLDFVKIRYGSQSTPTHVAGLIEVVDSKALKLEPEWPGVLWAATRLEAAMGSNIPDASVEDFSAFAALRDTLKTDEVIVEANVIAALNGIKLRPAWRDSPEWSLVEAALSLFLRVREKTMTFGGNTREI